MASINVDKIQQKINRLRKQLWPNIINEQLWNRKKRDGYTTAPRTLPLMMTIINDLTKGKPAGLAYFGLWARSLNECVVEIKDPGSMAFEIGFSGERRVTAWQDRVARLEELGFIKTAPGAAGKFSFVIILNPYKVLYSLWEQKKIQEGAYNVLLARAQDIGADDLEEEHQITENKQTAVKGSGKKLAAK